MEKKEQLASLEEKDRKIKDMQFDMKNMAKNGGNYYYDPRVETH